MSEYYEKPIGRRKIYGVPNEDGSYDIVADCTIYPDAVVRFQVTAKAAASYFTDDPRPAIQDIFPDLPGDLRELLITGVTPAEWDIKCKGQAPPRTIAEFRSIYEPRGYRFPDAVPLPVIHASHEMPVTIYYCKANVKTGKTVRICTGKTTIDCYGARLSGGNFQAEMIHGNSTGKAKRSGARCTLIVRSGSVHPIYEL